jgi:hypothetical protein
MSDFDSLRKHFFPADADVLGLTQAEFCGINRAEAQRALSHVACWEAKNKLMTMYQDANPIGETTSKNTHVMSTVVCS